MLRSIEKAWNIFCPAELDKENVQTELETTPPSSDSLHDCCSCSDSTCCESRKCTFGAAIGAIVSVTMGFTGGAIITATEVLPAVYNFTDEGAGITRGVGGFAGGFLMLIGAVIAGITVKKEC